MRLYHYIIPKTVRDQLKHFGDRIFPRYHPNRILIRGWHASGSTFLYQVANLLGLDVRKGHGTRKTTIDFTLFAFRDPRDIICSQAKRFFERTWEKQGSEAALLKALDQFIEEKSTEALYTSINKPNVLLIRYENYFPDNRHLLIDLIADNYLIPVTDQKRKYILEETSIQANMKRAEKFNSFNRFDKKTQIHGNHISNKGRLGAWKKHFTPIVKERVKKHLGSLILDLGYEENLNF